VTGEDEQEPITSIGTGKKTSTVLCLEKRALWPGTQPGWAGKSASVFEKEHEKREKRVMKAGITAAVKEQRKKTVL